MARPAGDFGIGMEYSSNHAEQISFRQTVIRPDRFRGLQYPIGSWLSSSLISLNLRLGGRHHTILRVGELFRLRLEYLPQSPIQLNLSTVNQLYTSLCSHPGYRLNGGILSDPPSRQLMQL